MTDPYAGGPVDWSRFDLPALAGFLDDDLSHMWAQVTTLWQIHDLAREHAASLRQARETIVRVWSPEVSQASAAYLAQLDGLIASRDELVTASAANAQALAGVLTVLEHAKATVDELHEKWQRLDTVTGTQVAALGVLGSAAVVTGGMAARFADPVLGMTGNDAEKARLNAQAQAVMRDTDAAAYAYLPRMVAPLTMPNGGRLWMPRDSASLDGASVTLGRGALHVPVIPPPAPAAVPDMPTAGPVLTGGSRPGAGGNPNVDSAALTSKEGFLPEVGSEGPAFVTPWFVDTVRGRVLRPGGVIGAAPEQGEPGAGALRRTPDGRFEAGRVNGSAKEQTGGLWGAGMGGVGRAADHQYQRRLPPDTEWPMPRSVPAVLEPPPEQQVIHDPGPGVIGIDR